MRVNSDSDYIMYIDGEEVKESSNTTVSFNDNNRYFYDNLSSSGSTNVRVGIDMNDVIESITEFNKIPGYLKNILEDIKDFLGIGKKEVEFKYVSGISSLAQIKLPFNEYTDGDIEFDEDNIVVYINTYIDDVEMFTVAEYYKDKFKEKGIEYNKENLIKAVLLHEFGHYFDFKRSDKREFYERQLEYKELIEEIEDEDYEDNHFKYYDMYFNLPLERYAQDFAYEKLKSM